MEIDATFAHDVLSWDSSSDQGIGNQRAMAAPGNSFRAHQRDAFFFRKLERIPRLSPNSGVCMWSA